MKRARLVQVTVSDEELQQLKAKAASRGLSVATWLRNLGLGRDGSGPTDQASAGAAMSAEERYNAAGEAARRQNEQNALSAGKKPGW